MRRLAGLITLIVPISLYAVTKFPFPHNANYSYGIKPSNINSDVVRPLTKISSIVSIQNPETWPESNLMIKIIQSAKELATGCL